MAELKSDLQSYLANIDFYIGGKVLHCKDPGLCFEHRGKSKRLQLPVTPSDAELLMTEAQARPAANGATSNLWEPCCKPRIRNTQWAQQVSFIIDAAREGLGISAPDIQSKFDGVLVCGAGATITAPTITLREDKEVLATLVICLPSEHIVDNALRPLHDDHHTDNASADIAYHAWFRDKAPQVNFQIHTYQVVLLYSLIDRHIESTQPVDDLADLLEEYSRDIAKRLVLPLDYTYSMSGYHFEDLEPRDQQVADQLRPAVADVGAVLYTCQLEYEDGQYVISTIQDKEGLETDIDLPVREEWLLIDLEDLEPANDRVTAFLIDFWPGLTAQHRRLSFTI